MSDLCPCASLDWREVLDDAARRSVPTPEHHPFCEAVEPLCAFPEMYGELFKQQDE
jgi:hypothetical protein